MQTHCPSPWNSYDLCCVFGYRFLEALLYGVLLGVVVSLVEKIPKIDDNITVPIVAAALVYLEIKRVKRR